MEMSNSQADGYVLAKTSGPIDESADPLFQEQLHPIVSQTGARVVIDLSGSPRINSRGLSALVTLVARSNTSGSRVAFCGVCPFVKGVFSVTKLDQFFDLAADEQDAASRTKESKINKATGNTGA